MKILVMGSGNVGTTLLNIILTHKKLLSIDEVYIYKRSSPPWRDVDAAMLTRRGAIMCSELVNPQMPQLSDIQHQIDYIFDCTSKGVALDKKSFYESLTNLRGASAQGTEKGFGLPFMSGVNPETVKGERYVQVVSCNTHGTASILQTLTGKRLENLLEADIVVVRRSEDIGGHQRLVGASVIARHLDPIIGTHHGIDVTDLFKTVGIDVNLTTSDVTTPSQLMHTARFSISLKHSVSERNIRTMIAQNEFISITEKFDSNAVFELGRRYGFQGRIYSHVILVSNNLLVTNNRIRGWIFVPQEGNTLLSTLEAYLLQTAHPKCETVFNELKQDLLISKW